MQAKIEKGDYVKIKGDTFDPETSYYEVLKIKKREGFPCEVVTLQSIYPTRQQEELITDLILVEITDDRIRELQMEWGRLHRE